MPDQLQLGFLKVLKGTCMEQEVAEYGIRYRSNPPYEVLQTKWLSYDEVIKLKGVEELVEMYYNSGQYTFTLSYVIPFFESPFDFFEEFSKEYRRKGCHKMNYNRLAKYEILREFLMGQNMDMPYLDEMLLLDMYLRENMKSRPTWADDLSVYKKEWKELYRNQGDILFPEEWQAGTYDSKKAANQSHLEIFHFNVKKLLDEDRLEPGRFLCLFDYGKRNPLNQNVLIRQIYT